MSILAQTLWFYMTYRYLCFSLEKEDGKHKEMCLRSLQYNGKSTVQVLATLYFSVKPGRLGPCQAETNWCWSHCSDMRWLRWETYSINVGTQGGAVWGVMHWHHFIKRCGVWGDCLPLGTIRMLWLKIELIQTKTVFVKWNLYIV